MSIIVNVNYPALPGPKGDQGEQGPQGVSGRSTDQKIIDGLQQAVEENAAEIDENTIETNLKLNWLSAIQ